MKFAAFHIGGVDSGAWSRLWYQSFFHLLCAILLSASLSPTTVIAEQRELKTSSTEKIDAVLLLDDSGSMRLTDPNRLRDEGAKLFIRFLKPGDRFSIIQFSKDAKVVQPLTTFDPNSVDQISQQISKIENTGMYTDLLTGVRAAKEVLEVNARPDATPVIIMLSDGKMEPDPTVASPETRTTDLFNNYLPDLRAHGIKVHALSFSDQADKDTLSQIAAATDGLSMFTPTADKIHESYANLFLVVKKPQVLPLTSKGFKIDSDVQEATFYINRENTGEVSLQPPSGNRIMAGTNNDKIKWFKGQKFDVVTIINPEAGDWKIFGLPSSDSFATVLTNLKLATDWPSSLIADEETPLQARLYESEKPVVLPEMTGAVTYAFQITPTDKVAEPVVRETLHDDGKGGDRIVDDGIFSANVRLTEPGEYMLKVVAHAPTFDRYQHIPFRVKPRLVSLSIETREREAAVASKKSGADAGHGHDDHAVEEKKEDHGHEPAGHDEPAKGEHDVSESMSSATTDYFVAQLSPETRDLKELSIKVIAVDRNRTRYEIPLSETESSLRYEVRTSVLPNEGSYDVQAVMQAQGKNRKTVRANSEKLAYLFKLHEGEEPGITVVAAEEEHEVEHEAPTSAPSPIIPIVMVSVLNAISGALVFVLMQRVGKGPAVALPALQPLDPFHAVLIALRERAEKTDVDLNDPIFLNRPKTSSGSAASDATAAPSEASASAPTSETDEEGGSKEDGSVSEESGEVEGGEAAAEGEDDEAIDEAFS